MRGPWILICVLLGVSACSFDRGEHPASCNEDGDCSDGASCVNGFCVEEDDASGGDGDGGDDCVDGDPPESCYGGDEGTEDVGECRGGERVCAGGVYTQCLGQVLPEAETCNGRDNDCDGVVDEVEDASCDTGMAGICGEGALVCQGSFAVCESMKAAQNEICNGMDDDCDGSTDEVASEVCYDAEDGCTSEDGVISCMGLCTPGTGGCKGGEGKCMGMVTPIDEECTDHGATAVDEDCDGSLDEGCACTPGDKLPCYAGPKGSIGEGSCKPGVQTCGDDNSWGECVGQVLPKPETCLNQGADNNCNGEVDDVALLGQPCIDEEAQGICRAGQYDCVGEMALPRCVGGEPEPFEVCDEKDRDCDGDPINGFDLNTDEQNCGECGNKCDGEQVCCGECVKADALSRDARNCGACGVSCGDGQYCCQGDCLSSGFVMIPLPGEEGLCDCAEDCGELWCCGTACVDIMNDPDNCGGCDIPCLDGLEKGTCSEGKCQLNP